MRFQGRLALASVFVAVGCVAGCSSDDTSTVEDGGSDASVDVVADAKPDGTIKPDASDATVDAPKDVTPDMGNDVTADAPADGSDASDGGADADGGLAPPGSPCNTPNAVQSEACGLCGTHYRGCLTDGDGGYAWGDWGFCQNQVINGCDPKLSYPDVSCGNCGTKKQVCLNNCNFDATQQCTEPSGACAPGAVDFQLGLSCDGGGRERVCSNQCTYGNFGSCISSITPVNAKMALGYYHSCAVNGAGVLKCWGYGSLGTMGNGGTSSSSLPVVVGGNLTNITSIGAGYAHNCAISNGNVYCWGYNTNKQIGDNTTTNALTPYNVASVTNAVKIEAGYYHSCAILGDGTGRCWGYNTYGQLGNNSTTTSGTPVTPTGLAGALDVTGGIYYHTCALLGSGGVSCWGYNTYGAIGDGTTTNRLTPYTIPSVTGASQVTAGAYHSCALVGTSFQCWGNNDYGQLGNGNTSQSTTPVQALPNDVLQLAAGYKHTCYLSLYGEVKCAGYNTYGQLGNGNTTNSSTFVTAIPGGARAVAAGQYHTCAWMASGQVMCWGYNSDGQIGDGTTTNRSSPTLVQGF